MQTVAYDLTAEQWTEVLNGNKAFALQIKKANNVRLHFNDSATAPAIDAEHILIDSFPPAFDFECQEQTGQARVWARADRTPAKAVVVRRTI